jgi:RimJ/RimL family protein N-acetyltransferase
MTLHPPELVTSRLLLRLLEISDSRRIMELAGDRRVYETTLRVPHPYLEGMAERWIASSVLAFYSGKGVDLAITLKDSGEIIGVVGLDADQGHKRAELGYWIGVPYWNLGYCTESARAVIGYGFNVLGYHKITSRHMSVNPASGRVMEKAGMKYEGELIDEVYKDGRFHTLKVYGIINGGQELY